MAFSPVEGNPDPATLDRLHRALASESRRTVLAHFEDASDETVTLDDLTDALLARRTDFDGQSAEQVRLRLHHADLPTLADSGLLDYDARRRTVRYRGHPLLSEWRASGPESDEALSWSG